MSDDDTITLLFTCVGRQTKVISQLQEAASEIDSTLEIVAIDAAWNAPGLHVADQGFVVPAINESSYIPTINRLVQEQNVDFVLPTNDAELLKFARNRDSLSDRATFLMPSSEKIIECTDKIQTAAMFRSVGVSTPRTEVYEAGQHEEFPCIIKSRGTEGSTRGYTTVESSSRLRQAVTEYAAPIVQEKVSGPEYTVDVLCDMHGEVLNIVPRQRLALRAAVSDKGVTVDDASIVDQSREIVERIEPRGFVNLQCMVQEEQIYWLEINPRIAGGAPLSLAASDLSSQFVRVLAGEQPDATVGEYERGVYMAKHDDAVFLTEDDAPPSA